MEFAAAPNSEIVHQTNAESPASEALSPSAPRSGTKLARVLELLQRDCGATLDELITATDWLPHTTRAALTGLRKRGCAVTLDRSDKERGSTYRARSDETSDVEQPAFQIDESNGNLDYPRIEELSARSEAASATERVMLRGRGYSDVGERSSLSRASSQSEAETLDATITGLAALDAEPASSSMAQSFGRDGSRPFAAMAAPEGSGLSASGGRSGDLDKATVRSIRASQGDAIDFAGGPFKKRKPSTRDGIGLNSGALLVREWKGKLERVMVLDNGLRLERSDLWQPFPGR